MKNKFFWILIFSAIVIFHGIFLGSIYWGDSPHFFPEEIQQFQSIPLTWTSLGNNFGGVNLPLWLSPLMFLWKWIPPQILFILPSILLSLIGPILLTRYLKLGPWVQFFSSAVYTFNTYFLLLIDGGQLGVALSYGIFPFTVLFLKKLIDEPEYKNFYLALLFLLINGLADPRITLVAVITVAVWNIRKFKGLLSFPPLGALWILLNAFWIIPFIKNRNALSALGQLDVTPVKFIDPLLLFSPHWPDNLFGKINSPPLYFFGIPLLILFGIYIQRKSKNWSYFLVYLFFVVLSTFPIGVIFRDSTKFYVAVTLFAGILIGLTVAGFKKTWFGAFVFAYIVFLVAPAILGKMNFVLSNRGHSDSFTKIFNNLKLENDFYRTAWFPERHPLTFETESSPALDAKEFVKLPIFANINVGEDPFNFINNSGFVDNFKTLGIRYLILSGNPREISKTPDELKNWETLKNVISKNKGLEKVDWGTEFPVYKIPGSYPHAFAIKKLIGVIGAPISMKYPSVNIEDGMFDPNIIKNLNPNSFTIYLNGKNSDDLMMSFLNKYFKFPKEAVSSEWAAYSHSEYLKYKYQLLQRGINFQDLDYGGGIGFSSIKGEKMVFNFNVPTGGKYVVAVRSMNSSKGQTDLVWNFELPKALAKGFFTLTISNDSDLKVVNAVALIPVSEMNSARSEANDYLNKFKVINNKDLDGYIAYERVNLQNNGTLKYRFNVPDHDFWLIFTDNYSQMWQARGSSGYLIHLPVYSMVNGYYTEGNNSDVEMSYSGQKYFTAGVYISIITLATLLSAYYFHEKFLKRDLKD